MEIQEQKQFNALLGGHKGPSVSIFMPTYQQGREVQQNPIRLKNLLNQAEDRLEELGLRSAESRDLLDPAGTMLEDQEFWKYQKQGLALFLSEDSFWYCRVPFPLEELVVASQYRFHIKPVLPLITEIDTYYVLTLSQNLVRLLECSKYGTRELDLENTPIPLSIDQALRYDDPERQLQFHSESATMPSPAGSRWGAVFHGQGIEDQQKDDLRRYFLQIDKGVREVIGEGGPPLVLAGVEYLLPIYSESSKYGNLIDQGITGNPDRLRPEDLHQRSWPIAEPLFTQDQERALAAYRELMGTGLASNNLEEIIPAAHQGRVDTLITAIGLRTWGAFNADTGELKTHDEPGGGDEDLCDLAAFLTLTNRGKVFTVEPDTMPDSQTLAATFRYRQLSCPTAA